MARLYRSAQGRQPAELRLKRWREVGGNPGRKPISLGLTARISGLSSAPGGCQIVVVMPKPRRSLVPRRDFLCAAGAFAGAAMVGAAVEPSPSPSPSQAVLDGGALPRRVLGRTRLEVTILTLGAAPFGIADDVPVEEGIQIVQAALDAGVNSIDTAPGYGKSEEVVGKALGRRRREIVLATKVRADTRAKAEASLAGSFKRLKTDFVDILYLHDLGDRDVEKARQADGVFTWLLEQKQAGNCRFVGISGHNLPARFIPFLESGDVDVVLVAVNFVDRFTYAFEDRVLPVAIKHDVGVVAMKAFGGPDGKTGSWGTRRAKPMVGVDQIEPAIRYALSLPGVATANLGVHTLEQFRQDLAIVRRFRPLNDVEQEQLAGVGRRLAREWGPHFGPVA
jgi:predicted aldo/keto reductase-like oxidoreductase